MKNMPSRLSRATPLKIARGVYRRARQGLSGLDYVKQLRHIAQQVLERSPTESPPSSFIVAPAAQVGSSQPAARPIILPDYSDLRAAPAPTPNPSTPQ